LHTALYIKSKIVLIFNPNIIFVKGGGMMTSPLMESKSTKKCPYCHARLKVQDTKCVRCKNKVGPPDEYGIAKKPTDWWSYILAIGSLGGFIYFLYWLFFLKEQTGG
jgi:hypothetical protein